MGERGIDKRRRDHSNVNQVFGAWLRKTDFREYFNYTVEIVTSMWYGGEHVSNNPYLAGHMKRLGTLHDDSAKLSPYHTRSLGTPSIIQRKRKGTVLQSKFQQAKVIFPKRLGPLNRVKGKLSGVMTKHVSYTHSAYIYS